MELQPQEKVCGVFDESAPNLEKCISDELDTFAVDELWSREIFDTVREARVLYQEWRRRYNHHHPHSALGWMTPAAFAAAELAKTAVTTP